MNHAPTKELARKTAQGMSNEALEDELLRYYAIPNRSLHQEAYLDAHLDEYYSREA